MLIDTEVVDAKGLVSLTSLVRILKDMSIEQLEAIEERLCAAQEAKYRGPIRRIREYLEQGRADGDLLIRLMRVALSLGELTVYALRQNTDSAFRLRTAGVERCGLPP